eukprot:g28206.t1
MMNSKEGCSHGSSRFTSAFHHFRAAQLSSALQVPGGHLLDPLWESTQEEDFISLDEDNAVVRSAPPSSFSPFSLAGSHQDGLARWFAEPVKVGMMLQEVGAEYGTTTGRRRRCGWLDLALVKYSALVNGFDTWREPQIHKAGLFQPKLRTA